MATRSGWDMRNSYYSNRLPELKENDADYLKQLSEAERREYLIVNNLRLVLYIAKKFTYSDEEELVSVGTMGLIKAAHAFDFDEGTKFATFATPCIRNEILLFLRKEKKQSIVASFDEVIGVGHDGSELKLCDVLVGEESATTKVEEESEFEDMMKQIKSLDERSRKVICWRYGIGCNPMSQEEIGKILGLSQSYVSRMEHKALAKMRRRMCLCTYNR